VGVGQDSFWPLFDLVVRTPRLELRLPRDHEFAALIEVIDAGVHEPGTMPFSVPWTDGDPRLRARRSAQFWWGQRAAWSPDDWAFTGGVFVAGRPVGVQELSAKHFAAVRSVETGSWLGLAHQGKGLGREMREAILHLAFDGLGAVEALSGAFDDNASSLATSQSVGYEENGEARSSRRGGTGRIVRFRMSRETWESRRRDDIEIDGLSPCVEMFGGSPR
jgi:RimJ/RimL family protein N-acetyltransferase